jgi:hypothetical protein
MMEDDKFTEEKRKLDLWKTKRDKNHYKIITLLFICENGLEINILTAIISLMEISDNPSGAIRSLMSNSGNNYVKILKRDDENNIAIIPELKDYINQTWF